MLSQFQTDTIFEIVLQAILLIQSFYKCIYFLSIYDQIAQIIILGTMIVKEVIGFVVFIAVLMVAFSMQATVLHMDINDPDGLYDDVPSKFVKQMLSTYA